MNSQLVSVLLSCALATPLCAADLHAFSGTSFSDPWAANFGSVGRFGRAEAGDLNDDGVPDVLMFDGDRPVLLLDPDQYYAPLELPLCANDGSILHALDGHSRATIALVDHSGLQLAAFDADDAHFDISVAASGAWAGAVLVRCADLDGNGTDDVLGLGADRRSVLRLMRTGDSSFAPAATMNALADVIDILALQWDGDAAAELAILSNAGLQVCDDTGVVLAAWSSVLPGGTIARVHEVAHSIDRLVWITAYAVPAKQWLLTVSSVGVESWIDLGGLDAVASVGADFDTDGDDDLVISHRFSHELLCIENARSPANPNAQSFVAAANYMQLIRVGPPQVPAPDNCAWPALADFDGDGDLDVVFGVEHTGTVQTIRGDRTNESNRRVGVASAGYQHSLQLQQGKLMLELSAPLTVPANATGIEIDLRRRACASSHVEQEPIARLEIAVPTQWPATVALTIPEAQLGFTCVYEVQLRLIERDSSGVLRAVHPTTPVSFAVRTTVVHDLLNAPGACAGIHVDACVPEDATLTPTLVPVIRLSRFGENQPPVAKVADVTIHI